ncbi:MAG: hypothetical protein JWO82_2966 [Akkermansiaceae bacterium]|nr:hypothetical protein [Akkermansiaceae bacterium]
MHSPLRFSLSPLLLVAALTPCARAVVIRTGTADFTNTVRLAWMPDRHEENPGFPIPIASLRGIGWPEQSTGEWHRQMAMISPLHFVYANHYTVSNTWRLSFELADGTLLNQQILNTQTVKNAQGQDTDLLLGTLQAPVSLAATGIAPFPVANLGSDANYLGQRAWVFGKVATAGRGTFAGFGTLTADGFNHTRFIYFDYKNASGAADDCYFESGDSGSPTFIVESGQPALIGTHSYENEITGGHRSYDTFIPDYLTQLDAMMDAQGYHVKRLHPAATTLNLSAAPAAPLQTGQARSVLFTIDNAGSADAHNLTLTLTFSVPPATLSGSGWICEQGDTAGAWLCRRGGVPQAGTAPLTASWSDPGDSGSISVNGSLGWDGGNAVTLAATLPVSASSTSFYTAWAASLSQPGAAEDPDRDGVVNLLEYAFGGDPAAASTMAIGGYPLLPRLKDSTLLFARRTDASQRGLVYHLETSTDLSSWTESLPAGASASEVPFIPAVDGFDEEVVTLPREAMRYFRVRVEMTP